MKEKLISGGYTVILQGAYIFSYFLVFFAMALLLRNTKLESGAWIFLITIAVISSLGIVRQLIFADIYKADDKIIVKKLIGTSQYLNTDIEEIDEGVFPYNYYIRFKNQRKVYFRLKEDDLFKRIGEFDERNVLRSIRNELLSS